MKGVLKRRRRAQAMRRALAEPPRGESGAAGDDAVWHVLRLASLSTLMREYIAMHALSRCAFAPVLLGAQLPKAQHKQPALVIPEVPPNEQYANPIGFWG